VCVSVSVSVSVSERVSVKSASDDLLQVVRERVAQSNKHFVENIIEIVENADPRKAVHALDSTDMHE